ncbi:AAA family ATPase [Methylobacterium sp. J-088]|uniref:AAA family ATPase n=1 Tax=Methylobacterium sp. J-088 TaxID=2836664 RepID=UPI001FB898C3|nr:AAA family ATPase [Methylobacterium sp. J-088]MCJ2065984.1 AAA family ATPase [Methylobacterium sp. J-088]
MTYDPLAFPEDAFIPEPEEEPDPLQSPRDTLAWLLLCETLGALGRRRVAGSRSLALVIEAPSEGYVAPLRDAASRLADFHFQCVRTGSDKVRDKPTYENALVSEKLARGGRICGVSQDPKRYLPSALMAAADLRVSVRSPSNAILTEVIRQATGRRPRNLPPALAAGTDFDTLCAAIRTGSTPRQCVRRIQAIAAQAGVDATVSKAPLLETTVGYGDAHGWGMRLVADLAAWRRGTLPFESIDRTVVLASDPGLGKTTYVRSLARSTGLPLISTSVSSWFSSGSGYLDSMIKECDRVIALAASQSPAILFLDEIDALPSRKSVSNRNRDFWTPLINHILLSIDSAITGPANNLIVIAATNFAENLDPALVRPGRFNRIIRIERPDAGVMALILRQHLGDDLPGADLSGVAAVIEGETGAVAMGLVTTARARAREAGRELQLVDLMAEAIPVDDRPVEVLLACALHEAAHAVIAHLCGIGTVTTISCVPQGTSGGHTRIHEPRGMLMTRARHEAIVMALLAGRAAEEQAGVVSSGAGGSARSDLARATREVAALHVSLGLAGRLSYRADPENLHTVLSVDASLSRAVEADLQRLYAHARDLVRTHWSTITAVADAVMEARTIGGAAFRAIVARAQAEQSAIGGPQ